jgi:hypothetical protein
MSKVDELKSLKSVISAFKKELIPSKVESFDKHASTAEKHGLKGIYKKIVAFQKAIAAKAAKADVKTIKKVKDLGDKLGEALSKKSATVDGQLAKAKEAEKKKASALAKKAKADAKPKKSPKSPKAKSAKKPKSTKKPKSPSPSSFMWGGEDEVEEDEIEFM